MGKTITTLTSIAELMDRCEVMGVLIVAPLRVAQSVWKQEAAGWEHTKNLTFSMVIGSPAKREVALGKRVDVFLINYENLPWLSDVIMTKYVKRGRRPPFDMVVFDEVSKMANSTSKRGKAFVKLLPYTERRVGLTGTPATNGLLKLFGQYLCLDAGSRLGTGVTAFRNRFFESDYMGYKWSLRKGADARIHELIQDMTYQISAKDYLELPKLTVRDTWLELPKKVRKQYDELEKEFFVELDDQDVEVFSEAALQNKLIQFCNGAYYLQPGNPEYEHLHDAKLDELESIVEEMAGQPLLVSYNFKFDRDRIKKKFGDLVTDIREDSAEVIVEKFNNGEIPILIGHPASMGHGLNLQHACNHLVMFGLNWDLELYEQVLGRLHRNGQKKPVVVHQLLVKDSMEEAVADSLSSKASTQDELRAAIKTYQLKRETK